MSGKNRNSISALIVDEHPIVSASLALVLEDEGITVIGRVEDRLELIEALRSGNPQVLFIELSFGGDEGSVLIDTLSRLRADLPTIVYSMHEDFYHVEKALNAGARGYVTTREVVDVVGDALRSVLSGKRYLSPVAARAMEEKLPEDSESSSLPKLSRQELRVFWLLSQGFSTENIAAEMDISVRALESYYRIILTKLELRGMSELRRMAAAKTADKSSSRT